MAGDFHVVLRPCSYGFESFTEGLNHGLLVSFSKSGERKTFNGTVRIWRRKRQVACLHEAGYE